MTQTFQVVKIRDNAKEITDDIVAEEIPLTITLADKELVTLLCMPSDLHDLVTGFLFTSGLIKRAEDLRKITINEEQWVAYVDLTRPDIDKDLVFKRLFTSGCGRGALFYNTADILNRVKIPSSFKISAAKINSLMRKFQEKSQGFLETGGVHSAALADEDNILVFREDIGRHNAIDKVIGKSLEQGSFKDKILLSSGRVSSEVLFKAQKAGIPIIISQSAPTNQAVSLAKDMEIALVGFARGNRMNIYSKEERIICDG